MLSLYSTLPDVRVGVRGFKDMLCRGLYGSRAEIDWWYVSLVLVACVEAALPAYGIHKWHVTHVPLSYSTLYHPYAMCDLLGFMSSVADTAVPA